MEKERDLHVTTLSPEQFDQLLAWLDEPPRVIPALQRVFAKCPGMARDGALRIFEDDGGSF